MVLLVVGACWRSEQRAEEQAEQVVVSMGAHAEEADRARAAIVRGDLALATGFGDRIGRRPPATGFPPEIQAIEAQMRLDALALGAATDLSAAAAAFGRMSGHCAGCHLELAVNPRVALRPEPEPAPDSDPLAAEMARHAWAAEALWVSWVMRDDLLAARALLVMGQPDDRPDAPQAARELDAAAHAMARSFPTASWADRGATYGEMLTLCATCHLAARGAP